MQLFRFFATYEFLSLLKIFFKEKSLYRPLVIFNGLYRSLLKS